MQELKPAKDFQSLIANDDSLDALLYIKLHFDDYLPEEWQKDKNAKYMHGIMFFGVYGEKLLEMEE